MTSELSDATVVALPQGFRVALDRDTKQLDDTTLFGGSPTRVMRLSATGRQAWNALQSGPVATAAQGRLARRLTDAGLAHPRPAGPLAALDVTVIIPVRDRTDLLARCLTSLGNAHPVVVVDDGSTDPRAVAAVAADHAARVIRREDSGGPGIARNTGLAVVDTKFVAFLDSDCLAPAGWIEALAAQMADPLVGAVAPRIVTRTAASTAERYAACRGALDLGDREARVVPATRVAYVPTAALLVRSAALAQVSQGGAVFDPTLRYGEDVDVIWRLHEAGWRIRYDPTVHVAHHEPRTWHALLARRFRYGLSAAPLARRHPANIAPLVLAPWPALGIAGMVTGRPLLAGAGLAAAQVTMARTVRRAGLPTHGVAHASATATYQTWLGLGRYATQFAAPAVAASLLVGGHRRRGWWRRAATASLVLGGPLTTWLACRPSLDPVRFTIGHIADDIAYGAGVYAGCARHRTTVPLRPRMLWQPLRGIASTTTRKPSKGSA